ncbi:MULTISPECIES: hypothetical protein [unclassified Streptomyces]|uniref:hypothetical protein n=1 Tax=unclassified Streptomyces TaxID=2593676 RepID=UPI00336A0B65
MACELLRQSPHSIWDDPSMLLSIVTALARNLVMLPTAVLRRRVAKDAEGWRSEVPPRCGER